MMALTDKSIIENALLEIGYNIFDIDINKDRVYSTASKLFEYVKEDILSNSFFKFASKRIRPSRYTGDGAYNLTKDDVYYPYWLPIDFLGIQEGNCEYRIEGEFVYATLEHDFEMIYTRRLEMADVPTYARGLFIYSLASRVAKSMGRIQLLEYLEQKINEEKMRIIRAEGGNQTYSVFEPSEVVR